MEREVVPFDSSLSPPPVRFVRVGPDKRIYAVSRANPDRVLALSSQQTWTNVTADEQGLDVLDVGFLDDSVWIVDAAARRLLFLNNHGMRSSTRMLPTIIPRTTTAVAGFLADGSLIVLSLPVESWADTVVGLVASIRGESATNIVDSVVVVGGTMSLPAAKGRGPTRVPIPWAYRDFAFLSKASHSLLVVRQRQSAEDSAQLEVDTYADARTPPTARRLQFAARRLDDSAVRQWETRLFQGPLRGYSASATGLSREVFRPRNWPLIQRAVAGSDDQILLETTPIDSVHRWQVRDARGRLKGTFVTRPQVDIQDMRDSTIWAIVRSATGEDSLLTAVLRKRKIK